MENEGDTTNNKPDTTNTSNTNTSQHSRSPSAYRKLYPTSFSLESLSLRRKSASSSTTSPSTSPKTARRFSSDISDEPLASRSPPSGTILNNINDTDPATPSITIAAASLPPPAPKITAAPVMPRMTMRRTASLEADLTLAPLPKDKLVNMRRWILALAIVNFDLDLGPVVDVLYPEAPIDAVGRENIAFSSFPDSAIFDSGSEIHSFRIRDPLVSSTSSTTSSVADLGTDDGDLGDISPISPDSSTPIPSTSSFTKDGFLYGYALFHQRRDASSKRGYLQRSVVILSQHAYPALFIACLAELGPMYFARGSPALETACYNIASWPAPTPGLACELGFMGSVLSVELPLSTSHSQLPQQSPSTVPTPASSTLALNSISSHPSPSSLLNPHAPPIAPILASLPSPTLTPSLTRSLSLSPALAQHPLPSPLALFAPLLPKLWSLWETLALAEPIILFAKSPRDAALAVWWLVELVKPLPSVVGEGALDWRPYFTIHDRDFERLVGPNGGMGSGFGAGGGGLGTTPLPTPMTSGLTPGLLTPFSSSGNSTPMHGAGGGGGGGSKGVLLGVTNPFFETICKKSGWPPHVVSLARVVMDVPPQPQPQPEVEKQNGEGGNAKEKENGTAKWVKRTSSSGKALGARIQSTSQHIRRASGGGGTAPGSINNSASNSASPSRKSTPPPPPKPAAANGPRVGGGAGGGAADLGPAPGFHSKHQRYISKDRDVLKILEAAVGKGPEAEAQAVHVLRKHFAQRSAELLVPLNRYFTSLISTTAGANPATSPNPGTSNHPSSSSSLSSAAAVILPARLHSLIPPSSYLSPSTSPSPSAASSRAPSRATTPHPPAAGSSSITNNNNNASSTAPRHTLPPFSQTAFMASLKLHGSPLPFRTRAKQKEFYERWLRSAAFGVWMRERDEEARRALGGGA
ncbi:hypothetical protein DL93DRAFT_1352348 [Clavulina sp. PMI_390]|nr:hypothetical protein DL93DRAFT_1352348 [Clavulina sp. PMI_390]